MSFSYLQILLSIAPVFGLVGIGIIFRGLKWITPEADTSIMRLVINCLYPALIFENVLNDDALRIPANLLAAPASSFVIMAGSIIASLHIGRALGLTQGNGLRTFAFSSGINNYGYFAFAVCAALFGAQSPVIGLTAAHLTGAETAIWTIGVFVLTGLSLREGLKKLINGPVIAMVLGLALNLTGLGGRVPRFLLEIVHLCGLCGLTIGIIFTGCSLQEYLVKPAALFHPRVTPIACLLRLVIFPLVFLIAAKHLPFTGDMKRVLIVQAAMPAGMFPLAIAKHYNGQPLTAAQVIVSTTALGIFTIPLWIKFGMAWVL